MRNLCRVSHAYGLACSDFARHYSRNHGCFLFLWVLRCFTSPRSLRHPMCSGDGDDTLLPPGFPIRISPDRSLVASSPALIAGSHVLLRLLVPRHPPCALNNLTTKMKMLASTVQFSNNTPTRIGHQDLPAKPAVSQKIRASRIFLPGKNVCSFRTQQCVDIFTAVPDRAGTSVR